MTYDDKATNRESTESEFLRGYRAALRDMQEWLSRRPLAQPVPAHTGQYNCSRCGNLVPIGNVHHCPSSGSLGVMT